MDRRARTLTRIVERLYDDERFLRSFRRDPGATLARYRLAPHEMEAIVAGDAGRLLDLGVDVDALIEPVRLYARRRRRNRARFVRDRGPFEPVDLVTDDAARLSNRTNSLG